MERQEDLAGREPGREGMCGMHRESGLADPGHAADRVDAHYAAGSGRGLQQLAQLRLPPGEAGDIAGQRPRRSGRPARQTAPGPTPRAGLEIRPGTAGQP
jgi:hypothetical protein